VIFCALSRNQGADKATDGRVCFDVAVAKRHHVQKATILVTCIRQYTLASCACSQTSFMRMNVKLLGRQTLELAMQAMSPASGKSTRKATNVSLGADLLAQAKALHINISQAAESGLARAVAEKRAELWLQANQQALDSSNAFVEQHGLPLAEHQQF
jgi:antitoxin CcdA